MSYLSEIRKFIGCRLIISVVATIFVVNKKKNYFFNIVRKIVIGIYLAVQWSLETLEEVATRELKEETGLELSWFELMGVLLN